MKVPNLRFPEFEREWEETKLGEITKWASGGTPPKDNPNYWNGEIPWISASSMRGIEYSDSHLKITETGLNKGSKLAKKGSLLLLVRGSMLFNKIPIGIATKDVAFNQDVKSIEVLNGINNLFILYTLISSERNLLNIVTGTGIGAGKLDLNDLKETIINLPKLSEQTKIATFLSLIDERISTQIKIIEELNTFKSLICNKLFSKQLRLKDNNGHCFEDWKIKKLGDVFFSEKGKGLSKNKVNENGKFECILYGELYTKYKEVITEISSKTNETEGLKSKKGDLLLPSSTTTTGIDLANVTALNKAGVLLGGDITVLRSNEEVDNIFYAYYLTHFKKDEIASYAQGSTIVHLYFSHIRNMLTDVPCLEEQTKIANLLSTIDNKIETEKLILEKYQNQKKYLLQNLFV